jgi:hypothetical protein
MDVTALRSSSSLSSGARPQAACLLTLLSPKPACLRSGCKWMAGRHTDKKAAVQPAAAPPSVEYPTQTVGHPHVML